MKRILTKEWWAAAGIRAIKTVAQTAIATIGTSAAISEVNWVLVGSSSLLAGILSLLTSLTGLPEVEEKHATITVEEEPASDGQSENDEYIGDE